MSNISEEEVKKLETLNMDEGAPLHTWNLRADTYYFEELDGITSKNCEMYARSNCKMCNSKGYRVYNMGNLIWRQACECVKRRVQKLSSSI